MVKERRMARRLALDVLYEAEIRDLLPVEAYEARGEQEWLGLLSEDDRSSTEGSSDQVLGYARVLIEGVQSNQADIDALIAAYADRWAIQRMPIIDRNLLRIGLFELLWDEAMPVAVAINEAVELGKTLSTDDSGRFINGLLGRIAEDQRGG
jgi:transcription antitermination protein NusB